jgi:hypothetical protein
MTTPTQIAQNYIALMGKKDFNGIEALFSANVQFVGPARTITGRDELMPALRRLAPILESTQIVKLFTDGNDVCVIYDYVTNTEGGAVPTMEWLHVENGKIASIRLLTDHLRWPKVLAELQRRSPA